LGKGNPRGLDASEFVSIFAVKLFDVKTGKVQGKTLNPPALELIGPAGSVQNFM